MRETNKEGERKMNVTVMGLEYEVEKSKNGSDYIEIENSNDIFKIDEKYETGRKKYKQLMVTGFGEAYKKNSTNENEPFYDMLFKRVYITLFRKGE